VRGDAGQIIIGFILGVLITFIILGFSVYPLAVLGADDTILPFHQQRSLKDCGDPVVPPTAETTPVDAPRLPPVIVHPEPESVPLTPIAISDPATKDQRIARGLAPDNSMIAHIVQGSPYITIKYNKVTPYLQTTHAFISLNGQSSGSSTGSSHPLTLSFNLISLALSHQDLDLRLR